MTSKNCGNFISELRKDLNLTQKELAIKLNVSDKAISRWETGKGFPDVPTLVALSDFFGVSINELLAGKRIEKEQIPEISEENIVKVIETNEKAIKKKKRQMVICSVIFLILLLPTAIPTFMYILDVVIPELSFENSTEFIILTTVAVLFLLAGFAIRKGHIALLHSYHYKNVVDREGYCRAIGKGIMLMAVPTFICSLTALFPSIQIVQSIGTGILVTGYIITIAILFKQQYKYNGGLF